MLTRDCLQWICRHSRDMMEIYLKCLCGFFKFLDFFVIFICDLTVFSQKWRHYWALINLKISLMVMVVASLPQNLNSTKKQKIKIAFRIVTKVQKSFRANLNLFKCFIDFFDKSVDRKIQFMLNWHWIYCRNFIVYKFHW